MSHDLLSQMSSAARGDALADPRWEGFARGTLSAEEREDLLGRAREASIDEATIEALGPRDAGHDEGLAEAALAALKGSVGDDAKAKGVVGDDAKAKGPVPSDALAKGPVSKDALGKGVVGGGAGGKVIALRRRAAIGAGVAVIAAAAAVMLLVPRRAGELPAFAMSVEGGTHNMRSAPGEDVVNLVPGDRVAVTVRPAARVNRALGARTFLYGEGQSVEWKGPVAVSEAGGVRLLAPADELLRDAGPGRWKLCVVVGDPESLPDGPGDAPPAARSAGRVTVCQDVDWTGAPAH